MDDVAAALGVGRRTVFRYFSSKNDLVWGDFDLVLDRLRADLAAQDPARSMMDNLVAAVVSSNRYEPDQLPELRIRMTLITTTPTLQAHSMLRYAAWRAVVAEYVAARRGESTDALIPQTVGHVALGVSMAAFSHWVADEQRDLEQTLRDAWHGVLAGFEPG